MRSTLSLIRREFSAYFYSPIAYVVLAVFLAVTGHLFYLSLELLTARGPRGISYPMEMFVSNTPFWLAFLALAPLLTMRLFAEERSTGTLEMLMTAPVRDWQVVFAKFAACYGFYLLMWVPTFLYLPILTDAHLATVRYDTEPVDIFLIYVGLAVFIGGTTLGCAILFLVRLFQLRLLTASACLLFGALAMVLGGFLALPIYMDRQWYVIECNIDPWPIVTTYIGIALAGAMFLAIGLFISSLVKNQMIAALISLFLGLLFVIGGIWRPEMDTSSIEYQVLYYFTVPFHFQRNFGRGLIDTRNLVLYGSVAILGLFLTVRSLESRRWR
jgi:ABC-type transport system involved in multi-copper enzyme maturation permease subunit